MEQLKLLQSETALGTAVGLSSLPRCCSINYTALIAKSALTPEEQRGRRSVFAAREHVPFSSVQPWTQRLAPQQPGVTWQPCFVGSAHPAASRFHRSSSKLHLPFKTGPVCGTGADFTLFLSCSSFAERGHPKPRTLLGATLQKPYRERMTCFVPYN